MGTREGSSGGPIGGERDSQSGEGCDGEGATVSHLDGHTHDIPAISKEPLVTLEKLGRGLYRLVASDIITDGRELCIDLTLRGSKAMNRQGIREALWMLIGTAREERT